MRITDALGNVAAGEADQALAESVERLVTDHALRGMDYGHVMLRSAQVSYLHPDAESSHHLEYRAVHMGGEGPSGSGVEFIDYEEAAPANEFAGRARSELRQLEPFILQPPGRFPDLWAADMSEVESAHTNLQIPLGVVCVGRLLGRYDQSAADRWATLHFPAQTHPWHCLMAMKSAILSALEE